MRGAPDASFGAKLRRVVAYPFTGGAVALLLATCFGMLPYAPTAIAAGAFTIPVIRASGRRGPEADAMPRLLPPPPGLLPELGKGAFLFVVYLAPFLSVVAFSFLAEDVSGLDWAYALMALPLLVQVALFVFLPAAAAVLAIEGSPLPTLSRANVMRTAQQMGGWYGGLAAVVILGGLAVILLGDWLKAQGLVGRGLNAALVSWFWLLVLHLVGRVLRARTLFDLE